MFVKRLFWHLGRVLVTIDIVERWPLLSREVNLNKCECMDCLSELKKVAVEER